MRGAVGLIAYSLFVFGRWGFFERMGMIMSKVDADRTKDRKAYDRNHDAIKWPSKDSKKGGGK